MPSSVFAILVALVDLGLFAVAAADASWNALAIALGVGPLAALLLALGGTAVAVSRRDGTLLLSAWLVPALACGALFLAILQLPLHGC